MGRHSAPDEDDDAADSPVGGAGGVALRERIDGRPAPGRHHASDDEPVLDDEPDAGDDAVVGLDDLIGADDEPDEVDDGPDEADGAGAVATVHDAVTQRIPPVVDERPPPPEGSAVEITSTPFAAAAPAAVKHAAHNSADDLRLVRSSRAVLGMVVLAVLVPFAVDVVVLFVLGDVTLRRFLVWIWAPLIAAGVLVGVVLDIGHRRRTNAPVVSDG